MLVIEWENEVELFLDFSVYIFGRLSLLFIVNGGITFSKQVSVAKTYSVIQTVTEILHRTQRVCYFAYTCCSQTSSLLQFLTLSYDFQRKLNPKRFQNNHWWPPFCISSAHA